MSTGEDLSAWDNALMDGLEDSAAPPRDPRRCKHQREDGTWCKGWAVRDGELCSGHAGLIGGNPEAKRLHQSVKDWTEGEDEDGRRVSEPLMALRRILRDTKAPQAAVVAAARALLESEAGTKAERPRSVRQIETMPTHELVRTLEHAHTLPEGEMMGQTEA